MPGVSCEALTNLNAASYYQEMIAQLLCLFLSFEWHAVSVWSNTNDCNVSLIRVAIQLAVVVHTSCTKHEVDLSVVTDFVEHSTNNSMNFIPN